MAKKSNLTIVIAFAVLAGLVVAYLGFLASQWLASASLEQSQMEAAALRAKLDQTQSNLIDIRSKTDKLSSQVTELREQVTQARLDVNGTADAYQSRFHDLLQEHDFLLISSVRRYDGSSESFNASYAALLLNIEEVADHLSLVYGKDAGDRFAVLWKLKTNNFIKYSNTVKSGDRAGADVAFASDAASYQEQSGSFWAKLNPYINTGEIKASIGEHLYSVKKAVDYWEAKDYPSYFAALHDSYTQIGDYADVVVVGIIRQHPEKFQPKAA